jgi:undecaprenyl-diphosphatase
MSIAYSRHDVPLLPAGQLLGIACTTLLVVGAVHVSRSYATDVTRYAIHPVSRTLSVAEWWKEAWRTMPTWRIDLEGEREAALTVQWAGPPDTLKQRLLATGWQVPEPWSLSGAFSWLASQPLPAKLPVLPQLRAGMAG